MGDSSTPPGLIGRCGMASHRDAPRLEKIEFFLSQAVNATKAVIGLFLYLLLLRNVNIYKSIVCKASPNFIVSIGRFWLKRRTFVTY